MLRMALEKDPDNSLYAQALLRNLRAQGEWQECTKLADGLLHGGAEISRRQEQMIMLDLLVAYIALESEVALPLARAMVGKFPENLDAHYYLGTLLMEAEDLDGTINALKNYVVIRNRIKTVGLYESLMLETWGWIALAYNNLGVAYWKRGDLMDALYSMFIGRNLNGELEGLQENMRQIMGTLLFKKGEIERYFPEIGEAREEGV
jgi:tetratricopeptide (TPR) repeat protein